MTNRLDVRVDRLFAILYFGIAVADAWLGGIWWLFAAAFFVIGVGWLWLAHDKAKYLKGHA